MATPLGQRTHSDEPADFARLGARSRLIDASLTTIYEDGLSKLTLQRVAERAEMTAGSVNFHFETKQSLLTSVLRAVYDEFSSALAAALDAAGDDPAARLRAVLDVAFDERLCEPRKAAVWSAFMAESRARAEYLEVCGERDADYDRAVTDCCQALSGAEPAVAEALAQAVLGSVEQCYQELLFTGDAYDRSAGRARCDRLLSHLFPGCFRPPSRGARPCSATRRPTGNITGRLVSVGRGVRARAGAAIAARVAGGGSRLRAGTAGRLHHADNIGRAGGGVAR